MPRTNLGRNIANEKIVALIWGTAAAAGLTTEELGAKAKISRSRIYARKNKPEDLTLRELRSIGRALNIPIDELREAIRIYTKGQERLPIFRRKRQPSYLDFLQKV